MAKKIQLQDANGNVLHPLTLGECVTMSNGENLDTLMSKSQMFTPTITQDKSMFKVGTGVDVDYSANVKDGAYESLVFKGKSLVNLLTCLRPDTHSAWVRNGSSFTLNASGVLFLNYDALLKPNTTYTVVGELDFDVDGIVIGFREGNKSWEVNRSIDSRGRFAVLISTSAESTSNALTVHRKVTSNSDRVALSNLMVLEGDWTNTELPPYFEGLGSCKMPILRNVGKNLFDKQRHSNPNNFVVNPSYWSIPIQLKGNTLYNFSYTYGNVYNNQAVLRFATDIWRSPTHSSPPYNLVEVFNRNITSNLVGRRESARFTTPANGLVYLHYYNGELGNSLSSFNIMSWYTHLLKDVQLEEASSATSYEDHKTNILRTPEEIVLREVNGVQDTYNAITGEYVKRIGEVVLDGSENEWHKYSNNTNEYNTTDKTSVFSISINDKKLGYHTSICDTFRNTNNNYAFNMSYVEPFTYSDHPTNTSCYFDYGNNNSYTVADFKTWLSQNPVTIHYELAEPITTIVKPSTMTPFAYQNGHVILESGFEGQSLLPEIEYSVVTGRTGQVTQNTKVLRKQEQQIIGLEELLLTQVVQMEYERTLLQFDYELQMMMLG